jgi:hypothetical protein
MLPRSIKVGAHTYKIKTATRKELGPDLSAQVDTEKNTILITRYATRSRKIELVIHECLHAMIAGHDFKDEETILVILGEALTQFLADNPYFITEALKVLSDSKKS